MKPTRATVLAVAAMTAGLQYRYAKNKLGYAENPKRCNLLPEV